MLLEIFINLLLIVGILFLLITLYAIITAPFTERINRKKRLRAIEELQTLAKIMEEEVKEEQKTKKKTKKTTKEE